MLQRLGARLRIQGLYLQLLALQQTTSKEKATSSKNIM
jgi:hypothetical protein